MANIVKTETKCRNCGEWITAMFGFGGDVSSFTTATISNNSQPCPECKKQTVVDKEDMRVQLDDGTYVTG